MKRKLQLLVLILGVTLAFTGCKKDSGASTSVGLSGRWDLKSLTYEHYIGGKLQNPDNTTANSSTAYMIFEGKNVKAYDKHDEVIEIGTYTLVGKTLSITSYNMTISVPIKWISADEFSISNRYDISISKNEYEVLTSTYVRHK